MWFWCTVGTPKCTDTLYLARLCSVFAPILVGPDTDRTRTGYGAESDLPARRPHPVRHLSTGLHRARPKWPSPASRTVAMYCRRGPPRHPAVPLSRADPSARCAVCRRSGGWFVAQKMLPPPTFLSKNHPFFCLR